MIESTSQTVSSKITKFCLEETRQKLASDHRSSTACGVASDKSTPCTLIRRLTKIKTLVVIVVVGGILSGTTKLAVAQSLRLTACHVRRGISFVLTNQEGPAVGVFSVWLESDD